MIEKDFTPYGEASDLKQLGFDEPCLGFYERNQELIIQECEVTDFHKDSLQCVAPTYSQAFRFFREKHQVDSGVYPHNDDVNSPVLYRMKIRIKIRSWMFISDVFGSHSEAELECLRTIIGILKASRKKN
jgi:hypothetical protein